MNTYIKLSRTNACSMSLVAGTKLKKKGEKTVVHLPRELINPKLLGHNNSCNSSHYKHQKEEQQKQLWLTRNGVAGKNLHYMKVILWYDKSQMLICISISN